MNCFVCFVCKTNEENLLRQNSNIEERIKAIMSK